MTVVTPALGMAQWSKTFAVMNQDKQVQIILSCLLALTPEIPGPWEVLWCKKSFSQKERP